MPNITNIPDGKRLCRVGVHAPNRVALKDYDLNGIREFRAEALRFMSNIDRQSLVAAGDRIPPDSPISVRLYVLQDKYFQPGKGSDCPPAEYVAAALPQMETFREVFGPDRLYFHPVNEPNHLHNYEGWGAEENHAHDFNVWYVAIYNALKAAAPWAKIGFPGLAVPHGPQPDLDLSWAELCREAIDAADFLVCHDYWQNPTLNDANHLTDFWGLRHQLYHDRFPDKFIIIGEAGNSNHQNGYPSDPNRIATELSSWYQALWDKPYLISANPFILSSDDSNWDAFAWIDRNGNTKPQLYAVRDMFRPPI